MQPRQTIRRRSVIRALALGGAALIGGAAPLRASAARQDQSTLSLPGIGLPVAAWEERYGPGEEIDPLRQIYRYDHPDHRGAALYATVVDDLVTHVEIDYTGTSAGVLGEEDAAGAIADLLPHDASSAASYLAAGTSVGRTVHAWQRFTSEALARATGGDGTALLGYQMGAPASSPTQDRSVIRSTLTMGIASEQDVTGWATPGGFGMSLDEVSRFWGPGEAGQSGWVYAGLAVDGGDILAGTTSVDGEPVITSARVFWGMNLLTDGTDGSSATNQLRGMLPYDAVRTGIFPLPPTPDGPLGLICEHWQCDSLGERLGGPDTILSVTWYHGDAETIVPRLDIMAEES
ncbi:MAG TPA: hypothetical protein VGT61_10460 [Thermomicrobiales bacterium]|jgi:hypothetical protein|nr:hypothetical protein [Thermomicrobiales bacterium]